MREYQILVVNKTYLMSDLQIALNYARLESMNGYRVSVLKKGVKLATYQNGDLKEWYL